MGRKKQTLNSTFTKAYKYQQLKSLFKHFDEQEKGELNRGGKPKLRLGPETVIVKTRKKRTTPFSEKEIAQHARFKSASSKAKSERDKLRETGADPSLWKGRPAWNNLMAKYLAAK